MRNLGTVGVVYFAPVDPKIRSGIGRFDSFVVESSHKQPKNKTISQKNFVKKENHPKPQLIVHTDGNSCLILIVHGQRLEMALLCEDI